MGVSTDDRSSSLGENLPLNTGKSTAILPAAHLAEFKTKPRNTQSTNEL
jgi:hypothetical protein